MGAERAAELGRSLGEQRRQSTSNVTRGAKTFDRVCKLANLAVAKREIQEITIKRGVGHGDKLEVLLLFLNEELIR